jgi:hypothetical protein
MRLAIMQPYFFPYLGYFELLDNVDCWLVFDNAQYVRRGWINRNRIMHPREGWKYLTVPVSRAPQKTEIRHMRLVEGLDWKQHVLKEVAHYKASAPNYRALVEIISDIDCADGGSLSQLNLDLVTKVCEVLGIEVQIALASALQQAEPKDLSAQQRILHYCKILNAETYLNLPGGRDLYEARAFETQGIKLRFLKERKYKLNHQPESVPANLSVIDAMMWADAGDIRACLDHGGLTQ